jgi:hypothetical protein
MLGSYRPTYRPLKHKVAPDPIIDVTSTAPTPTPIAVFAGDNLDIPEFLLRRPQQRRAA